MNSKIERCTGCSDQCTLQRKSDTIVAEVKSGSINTLGEVRGKVSKMLQQARLNGCPSSEIEGTQRKTFEQTDSRLVVSPLFMRRLNGPSKPFE